MFRNSIRIILASASPRRKELLSSIIKDFDIEPSNVDEGSTYNFPKKMVLDIAKQKANSISGDFVIASDTIVFFKNKPLGKPKDKLEAKKMLEKLNGKWHKVATAVVVKVFGNLHFFVEVSKVKFNNMTENQIENYIEKFTPLDKAGSYGIQDGVVVEKYKGSYTNIVGLPIEKTKKLFVKLEKKYKLKILK